MFSLPRGFVSRGACFCQEKLPTEVMLLTGVIDPDYTWEGSRLLYHSEVKKHVGTAGDPLGHLFKLPWAFIKVTGKLQQSPPRSYK